MTEEITKTTEFDPALDREVRELLVTARVGLLLKANFFGNLATRMKLVNADSWCPTAATDGRNFYYNSEFIKSLRPAEREFLFGHEVLHCVYDHIGRRGERDPQLWNIANDYCVNADLKKHGVGEFITTVDCLYDTKYIGWSSEQVYDDLYENAEKIDADDLIKKLLDEHLDDKGDGNSNGENGNDDANGDSSSKRPVISEEERKQIRDEIKEAMLAAAQGSDPGTLPKGVRRMVQDLVDPQLNWRDLLQVTMQSKIKDDYTWNRPSRRSWHIDAVLPGHNDAETVNIAIALDLSGSIRETQIRDFLSEVQGITETFTSFTLHVFSFDTEIYNYQVFNSDNLDSIAEYECIGGGGTAFSCIFNFLKEEQIDPDQLVIFTDGYVSDWGDPDYCDTLFILHSFGDSAETPYGTAVKYDSDRNT